MKCVFLDRDGVINKSSSFVKHPDDFKLFPLTLKALKKFSDMGYKIIIITNQSGIGRGYYTEKDLHRIHFKMLKLIKPTGVKIDDIFYCPHAPELKCKCRKPSHKMVMEAIEKHDIDPGQSFMIGDKTSDIMAGKMAGCKTILVMTGFGGKDKSDNSVIVEPDYKVNDIYHAALLVNQLSGCKK